MIDNEPNTIFEHGITGYPLLKNNILKIFSFSRYLLRFVHMAVDGVFPDVSYIRSFNSL